MWICHCQILCNELQMQSLFPLFASRFRVMQTKFIKLFTWSQHPLLICTFSQPVPSFLSFLMYLLTCPPALWIVQILSCLCQTLYWCFDNTFPRINGFVTDVIENLPIKYFILKKVESWDWQCLGWSYVYVCLLCFCQSPIQLKLD